ncbi:DUF1206 domain-containing protein [Maribacter sp. X9]|uniref:DUF1206 domain-containing protein n=1 Tax=Maribacter sp. X9 TaxID=3402159 RepID=UPI003AF3AE05
MNDNLKKTAYAGYIAKGIVYALTGILALLAAFNMGGQKAGKLQVIDYLENQIFGKWLVIVLGLGLICYGIWRFIESIRDPEGIGTDMKAIVKRVSFFISGCIYSGLGIFSVLDVLGQGSFLKGGGGSGNSVLAGTSGKYIFIVIGLALAGKGIYQFIKAYKGDFLKKFQIQSISVMAKRRYIKRIGYAGLISRGIVTSIIAYFFLTAGFNLGGNTSNEMKGTAAAFSFIQEQAYGKWLLGLVAAGLVCYGIYMFTMAAFRRFDG